MTIMDGSINGTYVVTDISMEGNIMRRLESLGTVIIKVRGTRWAIGRDIAGGILVKPAKEGMSDGNH